MTDATEAAPGPAQLHASTMLVATHRALRNALASLGFEESDGRIVETDGRLGFLTCSHDDSADDLFAVMTELVHRGESFEFHTQISLDDGGMVFHALTRQEGAKAAHLVLPQPVEEQDQACAPEYDLATAAGVKGFRKILKTLSPDAAFIEIRPAGDGRTAAAISRKSPREVVAVGMAPDDRQLTTLIRDVAPGVMLSISSGPAG